MARFFINRPIVAIVIAIITVIAGLVAMTGLPIAQFPNIAPPMISVNATYTGADAVTIEQSVATPIEQQMNGVKGMLYMQGINANNGTMLLQVTFDIDSDVDIDQVNTQNRLSQAQASLPRDVTNYGMTVTQSMGIPLLVVSLVSPKGSYDALFLANYATITMNNPLYRVPGVGQITIFGAGNYAMRIWVKPAMLAKLGLTVPDLYNAVQKQSNVNPAGQIGGAPAPPGQEMTYTVRAQGRLVTAEEFGEIVVRANPDGSVVRLKDVSRIELGALSYSQTARMNGVQTGAIAIYQSPGSNALAVADGCKKVLEELKEKFPSDLDYVISLDTTKPVTEGMKEIEHTLFEAMVLVILVVFIFLQNWRATLIPMIAVPVSLIGTFAVFPMLGFSINTLSLFGLVLAIGLVVDDAIVVVEAVEHHIEKGLSPKEATIKAMEEVTGPVVGIALVLSSVFIPVAFMGGIQGRLNKQFAVTIAISVIISAFNALTLSPALSAMLLRPRKESKGPLARFFKGFNDVFLKLTHGYVDLSHGLIRKSAIAILLLAGFAAADGLIGKKLPSSFLPEEDQGYFFLNTTLPNASSLQRTDETFKKIEAILAKTPGIEYTTSIIGYSLLVQSNAPYFGFAFVALKPWDERKTPDLKADAIMRRLNAELATTLPEGAAFAFPPPAIPGLGQSGGYSFWLQDKSGGSVAFLAENVQKFLAACAKRPELSRPAPIFSAGVPQVYADVNRDKVLKQGVPLGDVYQTLQAYLGGLYLNQFNRFGYQWMVFLQAEGSERTKREDIGNYFVRNDEGKMVPLSALVTTKDISGPEYTNLFNLYRAAKIVGNPAPGYSSGQAMAALEEVAREVLPREIGYSWGDLSYQEKKAEGTAGLVFGLSFLFVFLILAALYESWSLPFSVLLTVPVAVLGAFVGLLGRGFDFDVYAQIGLIMLIGLAAKNAILIVEFAILQLKEGKDFVDAALEGARLRLRPILMTSFAFILGCVPLWLASGSGAESRKILGTVVIAGMLAATGIAIFIIPALFVIIEKLAHRGKGPEHAPAGAAPPISPSAGGH
ncbi:MAG TPA: multidrug efflux RND transporter permease subunit [Thermoanaerobaculia bacterium]|nr:multidrug efflux RND transporter permease subunit [Thermoanaerobaculia bacterium]